KGARVFIASRKEATQAAAEIVRASSRPPSRVFCRGLTADLSKGESEQMNLLSAVARETAGKLHVLVNNAGTNWAEPVESYPIKAFEKVVALNLLAAFSLTRLALPLLEATATLGNPARVINIGEVVLLGEHLLHLASLPPILPPLFLPLIPQPQGSIDGARVTLIDHFAYSSSKAALHQLSKVLAGKLGHRHITVNTLAPGPFASKMMKVTLARAQEEIEAGTALGRIGSPEVDMAGAALFLASRAGAYVTGAVLVVDGGILVKPRL
ncbi:short chain dehydrogenase reductase family, partial [Nannochloropsis gaditana CCMP526]|uniref:short chain dehydrogenase reductase family n=1 Tax=Nannochloropsis gaditana (strain CCMP526) TaxID=1093141 RepID=UPI00029F6CD8